MQSVNFKSCYSLTGMAELGDEVPIYLIRFGGQPQNVPHFSFSHFFFFHSPFLAGDIGQMNLPEGMQTVDFMCCSGLTGTAELGDE